MSTDWPAMARRIATCNLQDNLLLMLLLWSANVQTSPIDASHQMQCTAHLQDAHWRLLLIVLTKYAFAAQKMNVLSQS